jgi:hypothetical protein
MRDDLKASIEDDDTCRSIFRDMQGYLMIHLSVYCNMDRPRVLKFLTNQHIQVSIANYA